MAHEGAHESLLRTPASRTGSCGSQSFVDLLNAPHFNFRYMVHDTTSWDVLRTYLVFMHRNMAFYPYLIIALTCLLLSIPRQHRHENRKNAKMPSTQDSACCSQCSLQALALRSGIPVGPHLLFPANPATKSLTATIPTIAMFS